MATLIRESVLPVISSILVFGAVLAVASPVAWLWDQISGRYVDDLRDTLETLHFDDSSLGTYMRWWGGSMATALVLFGVILHWLPLAVTLVVIIFLAPRIWLKHLVSNRRSLLRDQMVGAASSLTNTSRAGQDFIEGMRGLAKDADDPLRSEIARIISDYDNNIPLKTAINNAKDRLQLDCFSIFAITIVTALEQGGKVADTLQRISKNLSDTQRLERKLEAETASGKRVVWVLAAFPAIFLIGFAFLYPVGTKLMFTNIIGQVLLCLAIGLTFVGVRISQKILSIDF